MLKNLANYIREKGGIEKVRTYAAKNSLTMNDRSTSAKDQIKKHECIAEVKSDFFSKLAATGEDNIVVLVGYVDNNGTFQGKHAVFGEKVDGLDNIPSKNVIDAALSNMYATLNHSKKIKAEASTSKPSVNDKIKQLSI